MIRREVILHASPDEVWDALTRAEELGEWFGSEVTIDPRPRGDVTERRADGSIRTGVVLAAGRPYRLVVLWRSEDEDAVASRMEFTIEEVADGVRLTVLESQPDSEVDGRFFAGAST